MNNTKVLSLLLLVVASSVFVLGSSGFTGVSTDRSISLQVVNDERAYVGYHATDQAVQDGQTIDLVTVTNRFSSGVNITDVTVEDGEFRITDLTKPANIPPGESGTVRGLVECTPDEIQAINVSVTVEGNDFTSQLAGDTITRNFAVSCATKKGD
jgi:hypothetical protein